MTSKCITPNGYVGFPGMISWKDVSVGKRLSIRMLIFHNVSAEMRFRLLPPSMNTFFEEKPPIYASRTRAWCPGRGIFSG
jgi:hypothetical protein